MVDFVLQGAGQQTLGFAADAGAVAIQSLDGDFGGASDRPVVVRQAQAALFADLLAGRTHDLGVDQLQVVLADPHDDSPERPADLGTREAEAVGSVHGLGQVVEEAADGPVDFADAAAHAAEHGVLGG